MKNCIIYLPFDRYDGCTFENIPMAFEDDSV